MAYGYLESIQPQLQNTPSTSKLVDYSDSEMENDEESQDSNLSLNVIRCKTSGQSTTEVEVSRTTEGATPRGDSIDLSESEDPFNDTIPETESEGSLNGTIPETETDPFNDTIPETELELAPNHN